MSEVKTQDKDSTQQQQQQQQQQSYQERNIYSAETEQLYLKMNSKFFRGKFHKHIYLDPLDTNGYSFIHINSASKFQ